MKKLRIIFLFSFLNFILFIGNSCSVNKILGSSAHIVEGISLVEKYASEVSSYLEADDIDGVNAVMPALKQAIYLFSSESLEIEMGDRKRGRLEEKIKSISKTLIEIELMLISPDPSQEEKERALTLLKKIKKLIPK